MAVLVSAAIGDTVLLSAVLRDVKSARPDLHIVLFVGQSNKSVVPLLDCCHAFVVLPVRNPFRAISMIRREGHFDVWVDAGPWPRINALYSHFSRSIFRTGFRTSGQHRHFLFDADAEHSREVHELENYRRLFRVLGIESRSLPSIPATVPLVPNRAVVHAFAGGSKPHLKEWPQAYWKEVIDHLTHHGFEVFLTGAPSNRAAAQKIKECCSHPDRIQVVAGQTTLEKTADLLKSSALVLAVNTGILHVAAALGCRVIGIHGPTSVTRWGPLGENAVGIQSPRSCSPCLHLGFDYGCQRNWCMLELTPTRVIEEVERVLSAAAADSGSDPVAMLERP
jgi:ADP-heptose:LPS heptosyltransferase